MQRLRKTTGAARSAPCLVLVTFLKMEPKPKVVQGGSGECQERLGLCRRGGSAQKRPSVLRKMNLGCKGCGRPQKCNGSAGNFLEVVGRLHKGIGVYGRVQEGIGVRH